MTRYELDMLMGLHRDRERLIVRLRDARRELREARKAPREAYDPMAVMDDAYRLAGELKATQEEARRLAGEAALLREELEDLRDAEQRAVANLVEERQAMATVRTALREAVLMLAEDEGAVAGKVRAAGWAAGIYMPSDVAVVNGIPQGAP